MKSLYFKIRGCSWISRARSCRLADRYSFGPDGRHYYLGFRIFQEYK
jgi:formylglycine-generating enzyme required for sulfatase activity